MRFLSQIQWSTFAHFLKSVGKMFCIMAVFFSVMFQCFATGSNILLSKWSGHSNITSSERNEYLVFYSLLGFGRGTVCVWWIHFICFSYLPWCTHGKVLSGVWQSFADTTVLLGVWTSAKVMHNLLLHNILRVPLSFMDTTPIGRILSRFSKDVDAVDNKFTFILNDLLICFGDVSILNGVLNVVLSITDSCSSFFHKTLQ